LNILVLTPLVPYPPHDGDKLRLYHFLKYLKGRGHKIDLFCLTRVKEDFVHAAALRLLCRNLYMEHLTNWDLFFNLVGGLLVGSSMNVSAYFSPKLRESLKAYWKRSDGRSIDVVLAHRLRMAPAAFEGNPGKPVVIELTDSLISYTRQLRKQRGAPLSRRLAAWWDHWFLRREEVEWSEKAVQAVLTSATDAAVLHQAGLARDRMTVVPNGVDRPIGAKSGRLVYPHQAPVVCFVGNMGYAPNEDGAVWFLKSVWPKVKAAVPGAVFAAVGGQPRPRLRNFHNGQDVLVTGWVPEMDPYVSQATVSIAPLRLAAGMQNKVALSMAHQVPVVATSAAAGWMPPEGRKFISLADDAQGFANAVIEVLRFPKKAKTRAVQGQRFILKNYQWVASGRKLEEVLKQAVKGS
jgi:glycosyltransferase involved in cell wall biosynthesis